MTDLITLKGMRFVGVHGVSDEERELPQELELDLIVEADLTSAGASDDLRDTIDYGALIERCRVVVEEHTFKLLESIAAAIASDVLVSTPAVAVTVRVRKPAVPVDVDLDYAEIQIRRQRT